MIKVMNMGNPKRTLLRGIISILIGVTIFAVPGLTLSLIIQILGGFLLVDGIVNLMLDKLKKTQDQAAIMIVPRGIPNIIFGLILLIFPTFIISIFVFLIGFVLIFAGGSQLVAQLSNRSLLGFSWVYTVFAIIALIAGIFLFLKPFESAETMMKFIAAIIAIYGIGELYWSFKLRKAKSMQINVPQEGPTTVDTDYEEVK